MEYYSLDELLLSVGILLPFRRRGKFGQAGLHVFKTGSADNLIRAFGKSPQLFGDILDAFRGVGMSGN